MLRIGSSILCFGDLLNCLLFLFQLFVRDPNRRLGVVGNIRDHSFFKLINWVALEGKQVPPPFKPKVVWEYDLWTCIF